jgi:hypothetical protein
MGEEGNTHRVWWGNLKERDHLEDLYIDGRIILKCILKKQDGWGDMDWLDMVQKESCWEHSTETSTSTNCGYFPD